MVDVVLLWESDEGHYESIAEVTGTCCSLHQSKKVHTLIATGHQMFFIGIKGTNREASIHWKIQ